MKDWNREILVVRPVLILGKSKEEWATIPRNLNSSSLQTPPRPPLFKSKLKGISFLGMP